MRRLSMALAAALIVSLAVVTPAAADAAAEMYIDQAEEVLHHSCSSLVEEAGGDEMQIEIVMRLLVAVSFYNRNIDISEFAQSDEDKDALNKKFIAAIEKGCEEDSDALLAGVVDRAVVHAFTTE